MLHSQGRAILPYLTHYLPRFLLMQAGQAMFFAIGGWNSRKLSARILTRSISANTDFSKKGIRKDKRESDESDKDGLLSPKLPPILLSLFLLIN